MTQRITFKRILVMGAMLMMVGCATLPTDFVRRESYALTDTADTMFGRETVREGAAHPGLSGFHLLANGLDAFVARAALSHHAERSIDVQYYLYHGDLVGRLLMDQLLKAADRGIRVRLLVDDMDLEGRDFSATALDSHPNMEVRFFNPFSRYVGRISQFLSRYGSVTRRMHNKSFTVDNQITILGGRNIGNEYFDADPDLGFADLDVMAIGPVVRKVSSVFDLYWNSDLAYPVSVLLKGPPPAPREIETMRGQLNDYVAEYSQSIYLQELKNSALADKIRNARVDFRWGDAEVVFDQPQKLQHGFDKTEYHLSSMLKPHGEGVKKELLIFSPYFVPGKAGTTALVELAQRGVSVSILTNSLASNDVGLVHAGYQKYRRRLLRGGVKLYELNKKLTRQQRKSKKGPGSSSKASLHAKSFVYDRQKVFIGSLNLDPRSLVHNTEIGVVLDVPEIAREMVDRFDQEKETVAFRLELEKSDDGVESIVWHGREKGLPVTYTHDPHTSVWRRMGINLMSLLPIESQL